MHSGGHFVLATFVGFMLVWPLAWLFGVMGWPLFHGWGLMHGSILLAWPLMTVIAYLLLWFVVRLWRRKT